MKLTSLTCPVVVGLLLTLTAIGCRTKRPEGLTDIPSPATQPVPDLGPTPLIQPEQQPVVTQTEGNTNGLIALPGADKYANYNADTEILKAYTVHFDFDSSAVKASEKSKVAAVADYLKANAADAVRIEGNCDERGTEEYNRSLGERRALALREELVRLGIDPNRVVTISYGEDRPVDPGHNEAAWRKNRRGDFVLLTPPK